MAYSVVAQSGIERRSSAVSLFLVKTMQIDHIYSENHERLTRTKFSFEQKVTTILCTSEACSRF